mgnify:CR=1 FL=1
MQRKNIKPLHEVYAYRPQEFGTVKPIVVISTEKLIQINTDKKGNQQFSRANNKANPGVKRPYLDTRWTTQTTGYPAVILKAVTPEIQSLAEHVTLDRIVNSNGEIGNAFEVIAITNFRCVISTWDAFLKRREEEERREKERLQKLQETRDKYYHTWQSVQARLAQNGIETQPFAVNLTEGTLVMSLTDVERLLNTIDNMRSE